jgi:hypothetical protein
MNRHNALRLSALAMLGLVIAPGAAVSQQKSLEDQLVGTWIYVSSTGTRADGSKIERPALRGAVTYTSDGRFFFITTRTDIPKLTSNDPARPTAEEAMAVAAGSIAYTGTYTLNESDKVMTAQVETSTFENLVGAPNLRRIITSLTDDELRFTNPRTPAGLTLEFVWKRAK